MKKRVHNKISLTGRALPLLGTCIIASEDFGFAFSPPGPALSLPESVLSLPGPAL